jgi:tetratricopeptide (TPR) repeat protein
MPCGSRSPATGSCGSTATAPSRAARRAYENALALARELRDRRAEGLWLGNLGDVLRELGDYPSAAAMTTEALAAAREVGDRKREGVWLGNLGDIQLALGDPSGEATLRAAVAVLDEAWPLAAGVFRRHLGEALRARGAVAEARMVVERATTALRGAHTVEYARLMALGARVARADHDTEAERAYREEGRRACATLSPDAARELLAELDGG